MENTECNIIYVAITVYALAAGRGVECGLSGGDESCGGGRRRGEVSGAGPGMRVIAFSRSRGSPLS